MTQPDFSALATTASTLPMIIGIMMRVTWSLKVLVGRKPFSTVPDSTSRSTRSGCCTA
jgi:hypothetical protein